MTYTAIDCMGFAGGFTIGVVQTGFDLVGKRELPGGFGVPSCEANRHVLGNRWQSEVGPRESWTPYKVDLVFGNPPCSGFSTLTSGVSRGINAKINECMWEFTNYVAACQPDISIMESVRSAHTKGHELMVALRANVEERTGLHYNLTHVYQDALALGGAAKRPRYFMVLHRVPFGVQYPEAPPAITMRDVIGDLDGLDESWQRQAYQRPATWWSEPLRSSDGTVDGHVSEDSPYRRRCLALDRLLEHGWPEGATLKRVATSIYEDGMTMPDEWSGYETQLIKYLYLRPTFEYPTNHMRRWWSDRPGYVITGDALQHVMHPWLPRTITHREALRVMGYPDDWRIESIKDERGLAAFWGKGITTVCGRWIADAAKHALDGAPYDECGDLVGEREWLIKPLATAARPARALQTLASVPS